MSNGDIAVIGRDATTETINRLPEGVSIAADERLVIIPRSMAAAAKLDLPDA
ncbi:hypothetical protein ACIBUY_03865 [Streptomyces sp. NPDC050085]|uniref:hypothetical protein n=1 Tax=Streptomyces sp. NPDC050085 TaxID=3365600 RepID=UPI0037AFCE77